MLLHPSFTLTESITTPIGIYANFWRRGVATVADMFFVILPSMGIAWIFASPLDPLFVSAVQAGGFLGGWLGAAWFESSALQATPGKRLLGLIVTDERGRRISFLRASGRNIAKVLLAKYALGYLMALASPRGQALHDRFMNTLVTRRPRRP